MASAVLTLVLLLGMIPASVIEIASASQTEESTDDYYIKKVVEWGIMRGDLQGNLHVDNLVARADFVTMVNRAFGYTGDTTHPFVDVTSDDWFNDDIGIAYNVGYLQGRGNGKAAPYSNLTREEAVVLIGRSGSVACFFKECQRGL